MCCTKARQCNCHHVRPKAADRAETHFPFSALKAEELELAELDDDFHLLKMPFRFPHYLDFKEDVFVSSNGLLAGKPLLDRSEDRRAGLFLDLALFEKT